MNHGREYSIQNWHKWKQEAEANQFRQDANWAFKNPCQMQDDKTQSLLILDFCVYCTGRGFQLRSWEHSMRKTALKHGALSSARKMCVQNMCNLHRHRPSYELHLRFPNLYIGLSDSLGNAEGLHSTTSFNSGLCKGHLMQIANSKWHIATARWISLPEQHRILLTFQASHDSKEANARFSMVFLCKYKIRVNQSWPSLDSCPSIRDNQGARARRNIIT